MTRTPSDNRGSNRRRQSGLSGQGSGRADPTTTGRAPGAPAAGYELRALAVRLVSAVLDRGRALDDALAAEFASPAAAGLEARDRALARLIATTVLRRKGELEAIVATFIEKPLPADRGLLTPILLSAAAQLVVLGIAPHAVISIAVEQARHDRGARRFDRLVNAVLRRTSERGSEILSSLPGARMNVPAWMWKRWVEAYGEAAAARIAEASLREPALDLTIADTARAGEWAATLGGALTAVGSVRITSHGKRIDELAGFAEGAWWVQDVAATLPARLLGDVRGLHVADLCAAPGGKTAQLAAAGAHVIAVDLTPKRLARVRENLARLKLEANVVAADALTWTPPQPLDAVLLDAPCTATGTIRRHPDILHLKRETDIARLADLQARLLDHAVTLVRPGGVIVYCTCSLEPEEGERQIEALLTRNSAIERVAFSTCDGLMNDWITPAGELRTLPFHAPGPAPEPAGMDGFFAARLRVRA
jgi:16S rRNA (cytosine967-C5)-methyltransferase